MQENTTEITGVQHLANSAAHYQLRRYFPDKQLEGLVEQFWLVNWQLDNGDTHTQKNLPDANFHLVIENQKAKLIAPVTKSYEYTMAGKGEIVGVKFAVGALDKLLPLSCSDYIDQTIDLAQLLSVVSSGSIDSEDYLLAELASAKTDEEIISVLQCFLTPLVVTPTETVDEVRRLIALIKHDVDITHVEMLAAQSSWSVRTIQRHFKQYVGVTPKWLIRKYRLHQALALLEQNSMSFLDIVDWLDYTDQSHLIRDFKDIIGVTPSQYLNSKKNL